MIPVRAVTLDFYGTLVEEDDAGVARICEQIRADSGTTVSVDEIGRFWWSKLADTYSNAYGTQFVTEYEASVTALRATLTRFGADLSAQEITRQQSQAWRNPTRYDDVHPFLDWLNANDIRVCLLSNVDTAELERALHHTGLRFKRFVTSEMARAYKPRPEIFQVALAELGSDATETLHLGDSRTTDRAGAAAMGMPFAWINRTGKPAIDDNRVLTATSLAELPGVLQRAGLVPAR